MLLGTWASAPQKQEDSANVVIQKSPKKAQNSSKKALRIFRIIGIDYWYRLARARACNAHGASKRLRNNQRAREIQRASETSQRVSQSQRASEHVNSGFRSMQKQ